MHEQAAAPESLSELARHETQDADPLAALYLPASHAEHSHAGPVYPAAQSRTHARTELLFGWLENPRGHGKQAEAPAVLEYVPAAQAAQVLAPTESENLPAAQGTQVLS